MAEMFSATYMPLWALALAAALFAPVRRLIWVLYVRRAERDGKAVSEEERLALRRRAGVTALLLCLVFSWFYMAHLFGTP